MFDAYSRAITYLRVSVTDRCNLKCTYCMPAEGIATSPRAAILSLEEIENVVAFGARLGIRKVRLTGGEPLVRRGIVTLVKKLADINGISDMAMTTNGQLLGQYADPLIRAGLQRLNISLDTLDAGAYAQITRGGNLSHVLEGIDAAVRAGFTGIKLNCVVTESPREPHAQSVAAYGQDKGFDVRYIRRMNTETGEFWPVMGGEGGNCDRCNRLRLSSAGVIFPCLFSDESFSVRQLGIENAFKMALQHKPECGLKSGHRFYQIGG
ncbi:MAG: radical SAM protein [Deltaproteobacteria bacterium]|nr:radical SAM protein [Deltaproteobacteria bacterium]